MESFEQSYKRTLKTKEQPAVTGPLKELYWGEPVSTLCELREPWTPTPEWQERHRIYASLLMDLVDCYWNGFKYGPPKSDKDYPLNPQPAAGEPPYCSGTYYGHNIAALAVDKFGYVLDFDFNHNDLFNSSAEHAEARLVRHLYGSAQVSDAWGVVPEKPSPHGDVAWRGRARRLRAAESLGNATALPAPAQKSTDPKVDDVRRATLAGVTIYTSLESCAQCAGMMTLAGIQQVVYLQTDPQFFFIGRILRNLTTDRGRAPLPISGSEIEFPFFAELDRKFADFARQQDSKQGIAFALNADGTAHWSSSVTSFLCTTEARDIFRGGAAMRSAKLEYGPFDGTAPSNTPATKGVADRRALTNSEVQLESQDFLDYATRKGFRGTPHNI